MFELAFVEPELVEYPPSFRQLCNACEQPTHQRKEGNKLAQAQMRCCLGLIMDAPQQQTTTAQANEQGTQALKPPPTAGYPHCRIGVVRECLVNREHRRILSPFQFDRCRAGEGIHPLFRQFILSRVYCLDMRPTPAYQAIVGP
ncbi:hypothetical protein D3C76_840450 [compost metagenome]